MPRRRQLIRAGSPIRRRLRAQRAVGVDLAAVPGLVPSGTPHRRARVDGGEHRGEPVLLRRRTGRPRRGAAAPRSRWRWRGSSRRRRRCRPRRRRRCRAAATGAAADGMAGRGRGSPSRALKNASNTASNRSPGRRGRRRASNARRPRSPRSSPTSSSAAAARKPWARSCVTGTPAARSARANASRISSPPRTSPLRWSCSQHLVEGVPDLLAVLAVLHQRPERRGRGGQVELGRCPGG